MGTSHTRHAVVAALTMSCYRAPPYPAPQLPYEGVTDPLPGSDPAAAVPRERPARVVERRDRVVEPVDDDELPLTVSGIALDPTFASACRLPSSPRAFFEFDSADLDSRDVAVLRRVAACLTEGQLRGRRVELVGRTDPVGSGEYNQGLARARVEAVRELLRGQGVPAANIVHRIAAEALTDPLWPPGWDFDRRVDIRLIQP